MIDPTTITGKIAEQLSLMCQVSIEQRAHRIVDGLKKSARDGDKEDGAGHVRVIATLDLYCSGDPAQVETDIESKWAVKRLVSESSEGPSVMIDPRQLELGMEVE